MPVSMQVDYAARAMIDLGQHYEMGLTRGPDIAARQRIPSPFLAQLLTALRRAGLVHSVRGPTGGHQLARPASQITLAELVEAIEGPLIPSTCMTEDRCTLTETCVLQDVWRDLAEAHQRILSDLTLDEIMRRQEERESGGTYHI